MIKFISYTGSFPNLCSGILTVDIDGKEVTFGGFKGDADFPEFWCSGGSVRFDDDWNEEVSQGPWELNYCEIKKIKDQFILDHLDELLRVMNENVPYGCCGGCV